VFPFQHRDARSAAEAARSAGRKAKLLLLTDGLFSHTGEVAPLDEYLRRLPPTATLLVDDAHSAGILGRKGRGPAEYLGVPASRIIQTITLSKAFGVYGGAVLGSREVQRKIIARSRLFVGNTPLPLPLTAAALTSLEIVRSDPGLRRRLNFKANYVKAALREIGWSISDGPGPIIPLIPRNDRDIGKRKKELLAAGIYPPFINYLGGPTDGYFRFVISSEHRPEQLNALVKVLTNSANR
jgi:7-keto-8-aminopelargonate synthetase-like enzyme